VPTGFVDKETFLAGYAVTQLVPGPLFTFSAFLGSSFDVGIEPIYVGLISLFAIFLPSFFLVIGVLPFWQHVSQINWLMSGLHGINVCVVGLLLAAFYQPVITSGVNSLADIVIALIGFFVLQSKKIPLWLLIATIVSTKSFL
jgi:chromate transporter